MNDESQVIENIKTAETAIPNTMKPEELKVTIDVAQTFRRLLKVPCTGCQYCMPCPNGVNIPGNFQIYNEYHLNGEEQKSRSIYGMILMGGLNGKRADAALCKQCNVCTEHCPQHIAIPEKLKEVENKFGGPKTEAIMAIMKAQRSSTA